MVEAVVEGAGLKRRCRHTSTQKSAASCQAGSAGQCGWMALETAQLKGATYCHPAAHRRRCRRVCGVKRRLGSIASVTRTERRVWQPGWRRVVDRRRRVVAGEPAGGAESPTGGARGAPSGRSEEPVRSARRRVVFRERRVGARRCGRRRHEGSDTGGKGSITSVVATALEGVGTTSSFGGVDEDRRGKAMAATNGRATQTRSLIGQKQKDTSSSKSWPGTRVMACPAGDGA